MEYESFKMQIVSLSSAESEQGKHYSNVQVKGDHVWYTRESGSREDLSIKQLFSVYSRLDYINTKILREYITGRKYSPSLAILKAAGLYDQSGFRLTPGAAKESMISSANKVNEAPPQVQIEFHDEKAEGKFFAALRNLLDNRYVLAKSLGKPLRSDQIVLNSHFEEMKFPEEVNARIRSVLVELESDFNMPRSSIIQHIDGIIINHPSLGTRIIEFDEEQHFTPARLVTFNALDEYDYDGLLQIYTAIINNTDYFYNSVLKKHRLKLPAGENVPSWKEFKELVWASGKSNNGYISPKNGFPYLGGRIAQRAYYDLLRDLAHLSESNKNRLNPAIRVPKFLIEVIFKDEFENLTMKQVQDGLKEGFRLLGCQL
ncbi:MAG: hypothetical protein AB2L17_02800 [Lentimicrobium sp.]